jgi:hypothetical protein
MYRLVMLQMELLRKGALLRCSDHMKQTIPWRKNQKVHHRYIRSSSRY